jgi:anti-sigma B factor antagonist
VTVDHPITVGVFEGFSWIRCEGKGSFINSPLMKSFAEERVAGGETLLVVDLGACAGMDSTFMGTLAGIATRLAAGKSAGVLHVAEASERNRRSLEDLGLDHLLEIDPPAAVWRGRVEAVRASLRPPLPAGALVPVERARHVLEAHQILSGLSESNADEFKDVVRTLENELGSRPPAADER